MFYLHFPWPRLGISHFSKEKWSPPRFWPLYVDGVIQFYSHVSRAGRSSWAWAVKYIRPPILKFLIILFEFMFCKKSDGTTEYTLRFGALVQAESQFLLPLLNEILTALSRDPVVLATEPLSQCPFLRPVVSSAHSGSLGVDTWGVRAWCACLQPLGTGHGECSSCPGWGQHHNAFVGLPAGSFMFVGISLSFTPNPDTKHVLV